MIEVQIKHENLTLNVLCLGFFFSPNWYSERKILEGLKIYIYQEIHLLPFSIWRHTFVTCTNILMVSTSYIILWMLLVNYIYKCWVSFASMMNYLVLSQKPDRLVINNVTAILFLQDTKLNWVWDKKYTRNFINW